MHTTQEFVQAEIDYRLERAAVAALTKEARAARRRQPSRIRRWLTRSERPPVRHATPALP